MLITKLFDVTGYSAPSEQLVGIECEVESIKSYNHLPDVFSVHEDGSLRNNGREFVTLPLGLQATVDAFKNLHTALVFNKPEQAFSSRTSIHVHMNCQNLDDSVVRRIVLFYALFEEAFFQLVAPSRRDNIHCVALTDTPLVEVYHYPLVDMFQGWSKYTALNLLPLKTQGTIEFRHMHGHNDPKLLEEWLTVLNNLFFLAKNTELAAKTLTRANIVSWFAFVFKGSAKFNDLLKNLDAYIENTLIDIKIGLM